MIKKLLILAAAVTVTQAAPPQTTADLVVVISPAKDELAWLAIPWETDLTVARRKAATAGRPIFLWEMDGHPLGCT